MNIEEEIDRAARFGQQMEDLVYNEAEDGKVIYRTGDDYLLIAYWSLILDYSTGHRLPFGSSGSTIRLSRKGAALLDFLISMEFKPSAPVRGRLRLSFFLDDFQSAATTGLG
jgi:hypothetical protein